jgi:hypothetical protein
MFEGIASMTLFFHSSALLYAYFHQIPGITSSSGIDLEFVTGQGTKFAVAGLLKAIKKANTQSLESKLTRLVPASHKV